MTPEAQRIAIAEACGKHAYTPFDDDTPLPVCKCGKSPEEHDATPDYLNDLNAMHGAEKNLPPNLLYNYQLSLADIMALHMKEVSPRASKFMFHATAAQRAEAFLRIIGKWVEE